MIVYSCNMGAGSDRDPRILEPLEKARKGNKFILFTDKSLPKKPTSAWELRTLPCEFSGRKAARWAKMHPHVLFPHQATLWIDANMRLERSAEDLIRLAKGQDILALIHPRNACLVDEARQINEKLQVERAGLDLQLRAYEERGFDTLAGPISSTGFLFRWGTDALRIFNELWWEELLAWGHLRDQMSFDFSALRTGMQVGHLDGHFLSNDFFRYFTHAGKPAKVAYRYMGTLAQWKKGGLIK